MYTLKLTAAIITTLCLTSVAAFGFTPLTATIRVSSGNLYDYVVIGEHLKATDGFDNAYDTISPGNLNASMGQPFISVIIPHPDWQPAARELRGDIRAVAKMQEWQLAISSSLPKGTPLTVAIQTEGTTLPHGVKLTIKDASKETDLKADKYSILAAGPGETIRMIISVEQP